MTDSPICRFCGLELFRSGPRWEPIVGLHPCTGPAHAPFRAITTVGLDGRSEPMLRYADEIATLSDPFRSIVDELDLIAFGNRDYLLRYRAAHDVAVDELADTAELRAACLEHARPKAPAVTPKVGDLVAYQPDGETLWYGRVVEVGYFEDVDDEAVLVERGAHFEHQNMRDARRVPGGFLTDPSSLIVVGR